MHVKPPPSKYKVVLPLLLVHGWPGSVYEFYKILPMLTDPQKHLGFGSDFAFEVIAPSIPGYGWSEAPKKKGLGRSNLYKPNVFLYSQRLRYFLQAVFSYINYNLALCGLYVL